MMFLTQKFYELKNWANESYGFTESEVAALLAPIHHQGDRYMQWFLYSHAALAAVLATFYDTWMLAFVLSGMAILMFEISMRLLPGSQLTRCIAGIALQLYVGLHIYQMHGLPEMHFLFFTSFTMMVIYEDWLCMWPGALLILTQHLVFAILHNEGAPLFFFPEAYVGFTKLFFHFGIAIGQVVICGAWAALKRRQTLQFARQEADLREASYRAEEGANTKSSFLAMMSHEIRTPMNAVLGMSQLLLDTSLTHQQRDFTESLRRGADSLLNVINDVLDFSKIEAGKLTIHNAPFDLYQLLREVLDLMALAAEQRGLLLTLHYAEGAPRYFEGDHNRIRQIVINLVSNAIKYTDQGSVTVNVDVLDKNDDRGTIQFTVTDTGVGIPDDLQPLLFQEFMQLDNKMSRRHGGTGLGLAITRNLVHLMGGSIGFTSKFHSGSTFWFSLDLPVVKKVAVVHQPVIATKDLQAEVLVAEDNALNRTIITAFLNKFGCKITIAENGVEAVQLASSKTYDMILMDCQMPELDGYQATARIRETESTNAHIPIIAMTAHAMAGDREFCIEAGMDDYISKPISLANLAQVLERWAPRQQVPAEPQSA